jgi:hypothetical protein
MQSRTVDKDFRTGKVEMNGKFGRSKCWLRQLGSKKSEKGLVLSCAPDSLWEQEMQ